MPEILVGCRCSSPLVARRHVHSAAAGAFAAGHSVCGCARPVLPLVQACWLQALRAQARLGQGLTWPLQRACSRCSCSSPASFAPAPSHRTTKTRLAQVLVTCCTNGLGHIHQMERVLGVLQSVSASSLSPWPTAHQAAVPIRRGSIFLSLSSPRNRRCCPSLAWRGLGGPEWEV